VAVSSPSAGPWYGRFPELMRFEAQVRIAFPSLQACTQKGRRYHVKLPVDWYPDRQVDILFRPNNPNFPCVNVDGPTESPHRRSDGSLCIWYPTDPPDRRWLRTDGLLHLLALIKLHLFKEAWWREHGDPWLGPEVRHGGTK